MGRSFFAFRAAKGLRPLDPHGFWSAKDVERSESALDFRLDLGFRTPGVQRSPPGHGFASLADGPPDPSEPQGILEHMEDVPAKGEAFAVTLEAGTTPRASWPMATSTSPSPWEDEAFGLRHGEASAQPSSKGIQMARNERWGRSHRNNGDRAETARIALTTMDEEGEEGLIDLLTEMYDFVFEIQERPNFKPPKAAKDMDARHRTNRSPGESAPIKGRKHRKWN